MGPASIHTIPINERDHQTIISGEKNEIYIPDFDCGIEGDTDAHCY